MIDGKCSRCGLFSCNLTEVEVLESSFIGYNIVVVPKSFCEGCVNKEFLYIDETETVKLNRRRR